MSENKKTNKLIPPPIKIDKPEVPQIRGQVKEALDKVIPDLSLEEAQYAINKLRESVSHQIASQGKASAIGKNANMPANAIPANPLMQEILGDLDKVEKLMTYGYTAELPAQPIQEKNDELLEGFLGWVKGRIEKLLDNPKVQNAIAEFLNNVAKKVGEESNG